MKFPHAIILFDFQTPGKEHLFSRGSASLDKKNSKIIHPRREKFQRSDWQLFRSVRHNVHFEVFGSGSRISEDATSSDDPKSSANNILKLILCKPSSHWPDCTLSEFNMPLLPRNSVTMENPLHSSGMLPGHKHFYKCVVVTLVCVGQTFFFISC